MIGGATLGSGGPALGKHLAAAQVDEDARPEDSRGLLSEGIREQIAELTDLAQASGLKNALRHVHASPPPGANWDETRWQTYWQDYERLMGLEGRAFSGVIHDKAGEHGRPEHRHRVYLAITDEGRQVRISHDYARQEAVSRLSEWRDGERMVKGAHNYRASMILEAAGHHAAAQAMRDQGLLEGMRARSGLSPQQRAQQERTEIPRADVGAAALAAWRLSDNGPAFKAALEAQGLRLAIGSRTPTVVDASGATHPLRGLLSDASMQAGTGGIRLAEVQGRIAGLQLLTVAQACAEIRAEPALRPAPSTAAPAPAAAPVQEVKAAPAATAPAALPQQAAPMRSGGGGHSTTPAPSSDAGDAPFQKEGEDWASWIQRLMQWHQLQQQRNSAAAGSQQQAWRPDPAQERMLQAWMRGPATPRRAAEIRQFFVDHANRQEARHERPNQHQGASLDLGSVGRAARAERSGSAASRDAAAARPVQLDHADGRGATDARARGGSRPGHPRDAGATGGRSPFRDRPGPGGAGDAVGRAARDLARAGGVAAGGGAAADLAARLRSSASAARAGGAAGAGGRRAVARLREGIRANPEAVARLRAAAPRVDAVAAAQDLARQAAQQKAQETVAPRSAALAARLRDSAAAARAGGAAAVVQEAAARQAAQKAQEMARQQAQEAAARDLARQAAGLLEARATALAAVQQALDALPDLGARPGGDAPPNPQKIAAVQVQALKDEQREIHQRLTDAEARLEAAQEAAAASIWPFGRKARKELREAQAAYQTAAAVRQETDIAFPRQVADVEAAAILEARRISAAQTVWDRDSVQQREKQDLLRRTRELLEAGDLKILAAFQQSGLQGALNEARTREDEDVPGARGAPSAPPRTAHQSVSRPRVR